jgi:hypothetical protein
MFTAIERCGTKPGQPHVGLPGDINDTHPIQKRHAEPAPTVLFFDRYGRHLQTRRGHQTLPGCSAHLLDRQAATNVQTHVASSPTRWP